MAPSSRRAAVPPFFSSAKRSSLRSGDNALRRKNEWDDSALDSRRPSSALKRGRPSAATAVEWRASTGKQLPRPRLPASSCRGRGVASCRLHLPEMTSAIFATSRLDPDRSKLEQIPRLPGARGSPILIRLVSRWPLVLRQRRFRAALPGEYAELISILGRRL
jgi:hypothetical protein